MIDEYRSSIYGFKISNCPPNQNFNHFEDLLSSISSLYEQEIKLSQHNILYLPCLHMFSCRGILSTKLVTLRFAQVARINKEHHAIIAGVEIGLYKKQSCAKCLCL